MFTVTILNPKKVIFEGKANSVFLPGDKGEFEVMTHHSPVISLLKEGRIIIDWAKFVSCKKGLARFYHDTLVILLEQ